jgi:acyl-CoA synthetase (AMP-forming)/AMP-acid ligase II
MAVRELDSMADLIAAHVAGRPEATALSFLGRDTSFAALDAQSNRIANALLAEGLEPGDRIAILAKNSDDYLAVVLGAAKARVCAVALNWRLAPAEIAYILRHSEARLLFAESEFVAALDEAVAESPSIRRTLTMDPPNPGSTAEAWWMAAIPAPPAVRAQRDDDLVQMYTSGTTGLPKGVMLTHGGYIRAFAQTGDIDWLQYDENDSLLPPSPFFHVSGLNVALKGLSIGCRTVLRPVFIPHEVAELIARERITRTLMVPAVIAQLLRAPATRALDLSCLRSITYGGSPMPPDVLREAQEVFGCDFIQGYGLTETSGQATFLSPADHDPARGKLKSCGRPIPGVELRIVDAEGHELPPGGVGEILIRTPSMMKGYWRDPGATDATVVDGWLHSGDAGHLDDEGFLYIHDRVKDMIVSGGENIYPAEVESALSHHPAISDVAVIGVPSERWGEEVKAVVVLEPGASLTEQELIAFARTRIGGYKVPKSVDFIDVLPRNPSGKLLKKELREPYWAGHVRRVG